MPHLSSRLAALALIGILDGCAAHVRPPPLDDQTRRVAPLPACIEHLPARPSSTVGTMRTLREDQIWKLVFPGFDLEKHVLPQGSVACTGVALLNDATLQGGSPIRGWSAARQDGDIDFGSGGDRIKVVWLKLLTWPNGDIGGPIALVRPNERFADLFAVGLLRGPAERIKLGTERLGDDIVVTAEQDNCAGRKSGTNCESRLVVMFARRGELARAADLSSERVEYVTPKDKGATGILEYRMTTALDYKPDGIHLTEQITVSDEAGRQLRKGEVERVFALDDVAGKLSAVEPSLWDRFVSPPVEEKPETKPRR